MQKSPKNVCTQTTCEEYRAVVFSKVMLGEVEYINIFVDTRSSAVADKSII